MNREELLQLHDELCEEAKKIMEVKNHDYAGGKHESIPFANFTRGESLGICSTERGLLVRMTDKMSRLSTFAQEGEFKVKDESLRDTILDLMNYGILLYGYVKSKDREQPGNE